MQPHATESRELIRQVTLARPIALMLALASLIEWDHLHLGTLPTVLLGACLLVSIGFVLVQRSTRWSEVRLPLVVDLAILAVLLLISPSVACFLFIYLFVCYATGVQCTSRRMYLVAGVAAAALLARTLWLAPREWLPAVLAVAMCAGAFAAGAGFGTLGAWRRSHAAEHELLARLAGLLRVEKGLGESLHQLLDELCDYFHCQQGLLAFPENDLDRIFVWRVHRGETGRIAPESVPIERQDSYLLDSLEQTLCWNSFESPGGGFGWDRRTGTQLAELPSVSGAIRRALDLRSLAAVTFEFGGAPAGRLLLCNFHRKFTPRDLRLFERLARHLSSPLENLYLLRHLRARAIEGERSRISRDLHDGVLQTMLSLDIQLDVLRRKAARVPEQVEMELGALQQTVRNEGADLRRLVTDLRPLRVQSADLADLMRGFAERFQNESGIRTDVLIDSAELEIPDRICRELFQIYREALNNLKKHAQATQVVVKLWQDETKVSLVVDDNGRGFSFAGKFTSDELDRLRLGPISIKERARSVGGMLTVESNPGHGARLLVEVPLA
jgi:signal transduction histidine kinase